MTEISSNASPANEKSTGDGAFLWACWLTEASLEERIKIRYELADQIRMAGKSAVNWKQLEGALSSSGIALIYKFLHNSSQINSLH